MKSWDVLVTWVGGLGDTDQHHAEIDAETIEDAARLVWDEWSPTGWHEACVSGHGDWGWLDLDTDEPNFSRRMTT